MYAGHPGGALERLTGVILWIGPSISENLRFF